MVVVGGVSGQKGTAESFKIPRKPEVKEQVTKNYSLQCISGNSLRSFSVDEAEGLRTERTPFEDIEMETFLKLLTSCYVP